MYLDLTQIGRYIQSGRKEAGMTQTALGERLGVSAPSVSNWERGETLPDVSLLPDLACMLHCSVDAILSGGAGSGGYRRNIIAAQMQEALNAPDRIGELLGRDHFVYQCIIESLYERMNTTIELAFQIPIYLMSLRLNSCSDAYATEIMWITGREGTSSSQSGP